MSELTPDTLVYRDRPGRDEVGARHADLGIVAERSQCDRQIAVVLRECQELRVGGRYGEGYGPRLWLGLGVRRAEAANVRGLRRGGRSCGGGRGHRILRDLSHR